MVYPSELLFSSTELCQLTDVDSMKLDKTVVQRRLDLMAAEGVVSAKSSYHTYTY